MSTEEIHPMESAEEPKIEPIEVPAPESEPEIPLPEMPPPEIGAEIPGPELPPAPVASAASGKWQAKDTTDNDRLMAGLAYAIPIVPAAIMLLDETSKKRPFQRFHAIQSLGGFAITIVYLIVTFIVLPALGVATGFLLCCITWPLPFVPVVLGLYYAWQAYKGLYFKIPFLTDFMVNSKWLEIPAE